MEIGKSLLTVAWPSFAFECNGVYNCSVDIFKKLAGSYCFTALLSGVRGGSPTAIFAEPIKHYWTHIQAWSGLCYPPTLLPAACQLTRSTWTLVMNVKDIPWVFTRISPAISRYATSKLSFARSAQSENERVFWKQVNRHLQADDVAILREAFPKLKPAALTQIKEGNARCLATAVGRPISGVVKSRIVTALNGLPDNGFAQYITERERLENEVQHSEVSARAERQGRHDTPEMLQWSGARWEVAKAMVLGPINFVFVATTMLSPIAQGVRMRLGDKAAFAAEYLPDVSEPVQMCAEKVSGAFLYNLPLISGVAKYGYSWMHWGVTNMTEIALVLKFLGDAKQGIRHTAYKTQYYLAWAAYQGMLPTFATTCFGLVSASTGGTALMLLPVVTMVAYAAIQGLRGKGAWQTFKTGMGSGLGSLAPLMMTSIGLAYPKSHALQTMRLATGILFKGGWTCSLYDQMPNPVVEAVATAAA